MDNNINLDLNKEDSDKDDELESVMECFRKGIKNSDGKISVVVPDKMQKFCNAYNAAKRLMHDVDGVQVTYNVNEPFVGVGYISIIGKNIVFDNPDLLMQIVHMANNFEVYPKLDGTVQINFTFHGLTVRVDKESE